MKIIIATQNGAASGTTATQFLLRRIFRVFCPFIFSWSRIVLQLCCFAPFCVAEHFILGVFSSCLRPSCLGDSFNDSFDCIFYVGCVATTNSFFVVLDRMTRRWDGLLSLLITQVPEVGFRQMMQFWNPLIMRYRVCDAEFAVSLRRRRRIDVHLGLFPFF